MNSTAFLNCIINYLVEEVGTQVVHYSLQIGLPDLSFAEMVELPTKYFLAFLQTITQFDYCISCLATDGRGPGKVPCVTRKRAVELTT